MNDLCSHCGGGIPDPGRACPCCGSPVGDPLWPVGVRRETRLLPGYIVHLESPPQSRRANFTVLEEDGPAALLECPRCGWRFAVDAYTGENIGFDPRDKTLRETCPLCGTVQE